MKAARVLFGISIGLMFFASLSFLAMPYASAAALDGEKLWVQLTGVWLWGTLLTGWLSFLLASRRRRKKTTGKEEAQRRGVGLVRVFSNRWAKLADVVFALSLIGFLAMMLVDAQSFAVFALLCVLFFSFQMHCVLNGRNFILLFDPGAKAEEKA